MERTKFIKNGTTYNPTEEPIVLSKPLLDLFFKDARPSDVIGLYCFYYYTAKWQKTNQPKATTSYVAQGMKWEKDKIQQVKGRLKKLGLIEDIIKTDEFGKIIGHYIHVNFIWSKDKIHVRDSPTEGFFPPVVKTATNALNTNNKNALNTNTQILENFPDWNTNEEFKSSITEYLQLRKEKRATFASTWKKSFINKLKKYSMEVVILALENSVSNGYTGVFPENVIKTKKPQLTNGSLKTEQKPTMKYRKAEILNT